MGLPFAMRRRRLHVVSWRIVVASLLVGVVLAVVSVPVAAVTTTLLPRQGGTFDRAFFLPAEDHDAWIYTVRNTLHVHWQTSLVPKGVVDPPVGEEFKRSGGDPRPAYGRRTYTGHEQSIVSDAYGWPLPAAARRAIMDGAPPKVWRQWQHPVRIGSQTFWLPLRPYWPGLLANTLFYAALALTPMVLLRWRRTRRRRAQGLCAECGYELGEGVSVCPECGLG